MADIRGPDYELAENDYMLGMKYKDIAEKYGVSINTVKSWKQRYKWDRKRVHTKKKDVHTPKECVPKRTTIEKVKEIEKAELTEKQRLFCLYYIKTFNATHAAIKAGYAKDSAHVMGSQLLRNPKVAEEIKRIKGAMQEEIFIDAMDVLNKYIKIAFADITEYLEFGQREIQVMGAFGPIHNEEGEPITKVVNYIDFKDSNMVDGSLISEVKQGKDGASIKFFNKIKALEKLELYFDLFPDKFKRRIEEERIKMDKEKFELEKSKVLGESAEGEDDGFIEALKGEINEVWDDVEED